MLAENFYKEVKHIQTPWRGADLFVPLFYPDFSLISASFLVSTEKVKALLPSKRLRPYRITPSHSTLSITAFQYRECDIGPYNEVSAMIPITLDKNTPVFTGSLRKMPYPVWGYSHLLPVTTEIARDLGIEMAGYPKFLADISFTADDNFLECTLLVEDEPILSIKGRKLPQTPVSRSRMHIITHRQGYLLRSEMINSLCALGSSRDSADVQLQLGNHPISAELEDLEIGRLLSYRYIPKISAILTPVFESFPVEKD